MNPKLNAAWHSKHRMPAHATTEQRIRWHIRHARACGCRPIPAGLTGLKPLWTCPRCGHRYVTRNMWHSCRRDRVADQFKGKDLIVRKLFNRFRDLVRCGGPVTMYAQKSRIVFQTRARFAGAAPRKHWLDCAVWLKRRVEHRRFRRIESVGPGDHVHRFRVTKLSELDGWVAGLRREAYAVGQQEHLIGRSRSASG